MCFEEEILEEIVHDIIESEVPVEEDSSVIEECEISMSIKVYPVHSEEENKIIKRIERISQICYGFLMSNDTNILIKGCLGTKPFLCHSLVRAISYCVKLEGSSESFAIIKFYRGNCMSGEATYIYEDFVTPEYTIDTIKLERFIKETTNKETI